MKLKNIKKWTYNRKIMGVIFILPLLIYFLAFQLLPMLMSLSISFTEWDLRNPMEFVGLNNYINLFTDRIMYPKFWSSLFVTIKYIFFNVPGTIVISLFIAGLLNSGVKGEGFFKVAYFIPNVTAGVAIAAMWVFMLDPQFGLINKVLGTKIPFLALESTALPTIGVMGIWTALGYNVLIFLSSMKSIPQSLYEAAVIDGAGWWKKFTKITIPMIMPTVFFVMVTGIISGFQVFDQMYLMTSGGPNDSTRSFMMYLYDHGFRYFEMGTASAMSYILLTIILIITLLQFKFVPQRFDE